MYYYFRVNYIAFEITIAIGVVRFIRKTLVPVNLQGVYKRIVRFQKCIKRLHSATGRCSPHFHWNVRELLNRVL
jgi:hypothetical protein